MASFNLEKIVFGAALVGCSLFGFGCSYRAFNETSVQQKVVAVEQYKEIKKEVKRPAPIIKADKKKLILDESGMRYRKCDEAKFRFLGAEGPNLYEVGLSTDFEKETGVDFIGEIYPGEMSLMKEILEKYPLISNVKLSDQLGVNDSPLYIVFHSSGDYSPFGLHKNIRVNERDISKLNFSDTREAKKINRQYRRGDETEKNIIAINSSYRDWSNDICKYQETKRPRDLLMKTYFTDIFVHEKTHDLTETLNAQKNHDYYVELARLFVTSHDYGVTKEASLRLNEHEIASIIHQGINDKYFGGKIKSGSVTQIIDDEIIRTPSQCRVESYLGTCQEIADKLVPKDKEGNYIISSELGLFIHNFHEEGKPWNYLFREKVSEMLEPYRNPNPLLKERFEALFDRHVRK